MRLFGLSLNGIRLICLALLALAVSPLCAADSDDSGIGTLHMISNVSRSAGVDVPEGATLVGNLLIEYSYSGSEWDYITDSYVEIADLGTSADEIYLRASYYGNEPSDYDCNVSFSTSGWNRSGGRSVIAQLSSASSRALDGGAALTGNELSDLPISFSNLVVTFSDESRAATGGSDVQVYAGSGDNSFSIHVPVQDPISGYLVATLQASWGELTLPSGDYTADIQIEVSTNT